MSNAVHIDLVLKTIVNIGVILIFAALSNML